MYGVCICCKIKQILTRCTGLANMDEQLLLLKGSGGTYFANLFLKMGRHSTRSESKLVNIIMSYGRPGPLWGSDPHTPHAETKTSRATVINRDHVIG